ncbi:hypothetical protein GCK32_010585 [Trichostrongylus colubriformis]|uniref:Uncharacterized protein n=1 Tax=Trichostrongylus colubriformis TaxID=6319 RepID=A0AAN8IU15_TRICO
MRVRVQDPLFIASDYFVEPTVVALKAVSHMLLTMCLVTYYVIQTVGLITLLIVNRQLTKKFTGTGVALSTRYQLAENIRTIRVFLPMIVFDTLISLVYIVKLYSRFGRAEESEVPCFQLVDTICEVIGSFLEVSEVTLVICRYPKVKQVLLRWNSSNSHRVSPEGPNRILNVFGSDLIFLQRNFNYFDDLNRNWQR